VRQITRNSLLTVFIRVHVPLLQRVASLSSFLMIRPVPNYIRVVRSSGESADRSRSRRTNASYQINVVSVCASVCIHSVRLRAKGVVIRVRVRTRRLRLHFSFRSRFHDNGAH